MTHSTPGTVETGARVHLPDTRILSFSLSLSLSLSILLPSEPFDLHSRPYSFHSYLLLFNSLLPPCSCSPFFRHFPSLSRALAAFLCLVFSPLFLSLSLRSSLRPSLYNQSPSRALSIPLSSSSSRIEGPRHVSLSVSRAKRFRGDVSLHARQIDCGWSRSLLRFASSSSSFSSCRVSLFSLHYSPSLFDYSSSFSRWRASFFVLFASRVSLSSFFITTHTHTRARA